MKKPQLIGLLYDIARAGQRRHILRQALSNEGALYWVTIILLQTESVDFTRIWSIKNDSPSSQSLLG